VSRGVPSRSKHESVNIHNHTWLRRNNHCKPTSQHPGFSVLSVGLPNPKP